MSIRILVAAAAAVVGIGQSEAASLYPVQLELAETYYCEAGNDGCKDPIPVTPYFEGIPVGQSIKGILGFGDPNPYDEQEITFSAQGAIHSLGWFVEDSTGSYQHLTNLYAFVLNWDGQNGDLWFRDDENYWSRDIRGTIMLAPVPLPASAALLPLGIGALAAMRRRRRSS